MTRRSEDLMRAEMSEGNVANESAAAERLMRAYHVHCVDLDSLLGFSEHLTASAVTTLRLDRALQHSR